MTGSSKDSPGEELRRDATQEFSAEIEGITGFSLADLQREGDILEPAMEAGNASFEPNRTGGGTLTIGEQKFQIAGSDEAAFLAGLQSQANSRSTK